ncbi:MAG TPA: bifunctional hydroxymethylpyrimidine kinase/phosphomethylpyrimidine kinase [Vicinamibacterales bacterium]|nr:bifunctional hydroxymethylpyrimidine kinase/phosphomethylpyrimidine kinase [Vicinamibacterales bacterium]
MSAIVVVRARQTQQMHTALTIAGSDSGAGAGIQADLKTFAAFGIYGLSAITAVTAQNTTRVWTFLAMPVELVVAQIEAVASDFAIGAVKTGMLATAEIVTAVADAVRRHSLAPLVVDPVIVAKSGDRLLSADALEAVRSRLLPLARVVTPNRPEAEVLAGLSIANAEDAQAAAQRIHALGPAAVVIKGGHFEGAELTNLLFDGERFTTFATPRIESKNTHGTGCTFASAIAAMLAQGTDLAEAVERATEFVAGAVAHGLPLGHGHGPLDHFYRGVPGRTASS